MVSAYQNIYQDYQQPMSDSIDMHLINSQDAEQIALVEKMNGLLSDHRDLDEVIGRLLESATADQLQIQRLKKRKLILKDEIARLHGKILPDIIA